MRWPTPGRLPRGAVGDTARRSAQPARPICRWSRSCSVASTSSSPDRARPRRRRDARRPRGRAQAQRRRRGGDRPRRRVRRIAGLPGRSRRRRRAPRTSRRSPGPGNSRSARGWRPSRSRRVPPGPSPPSCAGADWRRSSSSTAAFDKETAFPGPPALLPTLGAAALIVCAGPSCTSSARGAPSPRCPARRSWSSPRRCCYRTWTACRLSPPPTSGARWRWAPAPRSRSAPPRGGRSAPPLRASARAACRPARRR